MNTYKNAHAVVQQAIKKGSLVAEQPCAHCGSLATIAHHEDYAKPLDVIWLCRKHHWLRHQELGVIKNPETRTTLILPPDLAQRLDDYWHTERLNTRNEAIRELLAYALDTQRGIGEWRKWPAKEQRR